MDVTTRSLFSAFCLTTLCFASTLAAAATGRSPGAASVTDDGQAAYSIPIWVPPGTASLAPTLSLEYRHRRPGGLLGVGWSLGGLSQMERCPQTIAQDGVAGAVTQFGSDRFCLDGQRLVVSNGQVYGTAAAEYRTEIESQARIRPLGAAGTGPQSFIVEGSDGLIREYGATSDSRIDGSVGMNGTTSARAWAINRIRDRNGNVIDFQYTEDASNGSYRIARIAYNANPTRGISASHFVSFTYEIRPSSEVDLSYVAGSPVREIRRLDRIDINHGTTLLRRYDLQYQPNLSSAGRSRLMAIQECGRDPLDCLAPTTFAWQDGQSGLGSEQVIAASLHNVYWMPASRSAWAADINGDGRDDLAWLGGSGAAPTLRYRISPASGTAPEVNTGIAAPMGATPLDYNGDGRADVLFVGSNGRWQLLTGTSTGLSAAVDTGIAVAGFVDFRGTDINGDGLDDIAWSEMDSGGYTLVVNVRYAQAGGGFSATAAMLYEQVMYEWAEGGEFIGPPGRQFDHDGDGRADLLMNENYTLARITADGSTVEFFDGAFTNGTTPDVNGDGCSDFAYPHWSGGWRVRFSGCYLYGTGTEVAVPGSGYGHALPLDWNGDGRDDLLVTGSSDWQAMVSIGSTLNPAISTSLPHHSPRAFLQGDWNGDGLQDIATHDGLQLRLREHTGLVPDLLLEAIDGFGRAARFTYRPLSDPAIYQRGNAATYPDQDVSGTGAVVAALSISDGSGTGAMMTTNFHYQGLRRNLHGRGGLGFASREISDQAVPGDGVIEITYRQDFPFVGAPTTIARRTASAAPISNSILEWAALSLGTGPGLRRQPYVRLRTDQFFEAEGTLAGQVHSSVQQSVAAVDSGSGLISDSSVTVTEHTGGLNPGASHTTRILHSAWLNDTQNWCQGKPLATQITRSHTLPGGSPVTQGYSADWDGAKCRPSREITEPGSALWQVTRTLGYDAFGNLGSDSVVGIGMTARVTTISWGSRGQFPERITNALSQATQLAWDYGSGLRTSITDPNGLVTRWTYDAYGSPSSETRADAGKSLWTMGACTSACDSRSRAQLLERTLDSTGTEFHRRLIDLDNHDRPYRAASQMPGGGMSEVRADFDSRGRTSRLYRPHWSGLAHEGYTDYTYDLLGRRRSATDYRSAGNLVRGLQWQYDGLTAQQTDPRGYTQSLAYSAWGNLLQATDAAGGRSSYQYDARGLPLQATDPAGNIVMTGSYSASGMLTSINDMNRGNLVFTLNALGERITERNARGQNTSYTYDLLGRLVSRAEPEGSSSWTWGAAAAARNIGQLASLAGPGYSESLSYDALGRMSARTINSDASYRYDYGYGASGFLDSLTYPASTNGYRLKLGYEYAQGHLSRIRDFNAPATVPWQLGAVDASGRVLDESLGTSIRVFSAYDPVTGLLATRQAGVGASTSLQDLSWDWDASGNLTRRRDLNRSLTEEFDYDALGRLDQSRLNGQLNLDLAYDATGNITYKSDIGSYGYHPSKRHAVTTAGVRSYTYDASGNMATQNGTSINWLSFDLPASLTAAGGNSSQFSYTPGRNRWRQQATLAGVAESTIYVGGLMEKVTSAGTTRYRHYIQVPGGTAAIFQRSTGSPASETWYLTRDHLGSTDRILGASGITVAAAAGFDAFGARRAVSGNGPPSAADLAAFAATTRDGFTSHEHLDQLGLIHMNGRLYDPQLGRFMGADPVVQAPYFSQSLNRYSYAWNNPLSRVDLNGFESDRPCLTGSTGNCAHLTVIGLRFWLDMPGSGTWQGANFADRDPCGQDGSAMACFQRNGQITDAASVVLTPAAATDPVLRGSGNDYLHGLAARFANIMLGSAPVFLIFGDSDFDWFDVPRSEDGQAGARLGNIGYFVGGAAGTVRRGGAQTARAVTNPIPSELARVVAGSRPLTTLGRTGAKDVFVVAADDIAGMNAAQLWQRLTVGASDTFTVIRFPTPASGIASPVFRNNAGFLQGGLTRGGAREFVIPNGPIPPGARITVVGP